MAADDPMQPVEISVILHNCDASSMRFHDYHLLGYVVSNFGRTITLNLVQNVNDPTTPTSTVEFTDVAYYQFNHSDDAIITDIREESLSESIERRQGDIESMAHIGSIRHWNGNFDSYRDFLINDKFRAWTIEAAIGFAGHIVAKSVSQVEE